MSRFCFSIHFFHRGFFGLQPEVPILGYDRPREVLRLNETSASPLAARIRDMS